MSTFILNFFFHTSSNIYIYPNDIWVPWQRSWHNSDRIFDHSSYRKWQMTRLLKIVHKCVEVQFQKINANMHNPFWRVVMFGINVVLKHKIVSNFQLLSCRSEVMLMNLVVIVFSYSTCFMPCTSTHGRETDGFHDTTTTMLDTGSVCCCWGLEALHWFL